MTSSARSQFRVTKKTLKACERCRSMKVKCSGNQPCTRCANKKEQCHFVAEETRVSVPESYLRELEQRCSSAGMWTPNTARIRTIDRSPDIAVSNSAPQRQLSGEPEGRSLLDRRDANHIRNLRAEASPGAGTDLVCESFQDEPSPEFRQNPLVDTDYTFAKAPDGRYWYMGPSSSWSFCRRVLALIGKRMPEASLPPDPWHLDGGTFRMRWKPLGPDETPEVTNLPPFDYALFLFNNVKFHFGPLFYLLDEESYIRNLHELYENPAAKATTSRHWYALYLLILAFGKAFTGGVTSTGTPPGYQYSIRAMPLLPDMSGLNDDSLLSIQVLTLAAVYFQAIDMRVAAFHHIGQAMRICVIEGMHRHIPEEVVGLDHSLRCNIIFWVVYMLERKFSALIGAPSSVRDEDITAKFPCVANNTLDCWSMTLHVRLSRLMARILTSVYGVHQTTDASLIKNTQSILRNLADLSHDLNRLLQTHFQGSVSKASRMAIRLILSYHHCVVLTIRPLVMCALHIHINQADSNNTYAYTLPLSTPVGSLIQSGVDSARNILRILRVLGDEDLIDPFLPTYLENAFSSAFILRLIHTIAPNLLPDETWSEDVDCILNRMIFKGNIVAPLRQRELAQLAQIMTPLTPANIGAEEFQGPVECDEEGMASRPSAVMVEEEMSWDLLFGDLVGGLDAGEILDLAAQLDGDGMFSSVAS